VKGRAVVHVLFTGGTISMRRDPVTGAALPALSGREIVARVPGLRRLARLRLEDLARLPGPHVTPAWMWRLKRRVDRVLTDPAVDGVVVTHGTDTLEETACLLDLTVASKKPVVLCGAMRTFSDPGWDGPANLTAAVRVAAHPDAAGRGTLVVVGEEIHAASRVRKAHTQRLDAFRSALGPVGTLDRGRVRFDTPPARGRVLRPRRLVTAVDLHLLAAGSDAAPLRASLARGARGLVLEGTGAGNVPPAVVPGIRAALRAGVPVVVVSRCPEGRVAPLYGFAGGGARLEAMGVVLGGDLGGPKARIRLMVALGTDLDRSDPVALRRAFEA
jgi:L-asparaginase